MMLFSVFYLCLTTILLFFSQYLFHPVHPLILGLILIIPGLFLFLRLRPRLVFSRSDFFSYLFIFSFTLLLGFVISPLAFPQKIGEVSYPRLPGAVDYFKHSYTITAINSAGLPPIHPHSPYRRFLYYYGYYLIPAAITKLTHLPQNTVLFFYVILTSLLVLSLLFHLIRQKFPSSLWRLLALLLAVFGTSFDIVPILLFGQQGLIHIENWFSDKFPGFIIYNSYTAFLWAPQHILPAVLSLYLVNQLLRRRLTTPLFILLISYIFLSSTFVTIALFLWLGLIFLRHSSFRRQIFLSCFLGLLLISPHLLSVVAEKSNLFSFYFPTPFPFTPTPLFNFLLTLLVEYGFLLWLVPFFFPLESLFIFPVIIVTLFLQSPGPNDFCMKTTLPVLLLWHYFILKIALKHHKILPLIFISLLIGIGGAAYEYRQQYRLRRVLPYNYVTLYQQLNQLPLQTKLAAITRDEWVFQVPVFTPFSILSPSLYDAGVYAGKSIKPIDFDYTDLGRKTFYETTRDQNFPSLIANKNNQLSLLSKYFQSYPFDILILADDVWLAIFHQINLPITKLATSFSTAKYSDIIDKFSQNSLALDSSQTQTITVTNRHFNLPSGVWFISRCITTTSDPTTLTLSFDGIPQVFNEAFSDFGCAGNLVYFPPSSTGYILSLSSTFQSFQATPLSFSSLHQKSSPAFR